MEQQPGSDASSNRETSEQPVQPSDTAPPSRTPEPEVPQESNDVVPDNPQPAEADSSEESNESSNGETDDALANSPPATNSTSSTTPPPHTSEPEPSQESNDPLSEDVQVAPPELPHQPTDDPAQNDPAAESSDERSLPSSPNLEPFPSPPSPETPSPQESSDVPSDDSQATELISQWSDTTDVDVQTIEPTGGPAQPLNESSTAAPPPTNASAVPGQNGQLGQLMNYRTYRRLYTWRHTIPGQDSQPPHSLIHFLQTHPQSQYYILYPGNRLVATFICRGNTPLISTSFSLPVVNPTVPARAPGQRDASWPVRYGDPYDKLIGPPSMLPDRQPQRPQPGDRRDYITLDNRALLRWRETLHLARMDTRPMDEEVYYRMRKRPKQWAVLGDGTTGDSSFQQWAVFCILYLNRESREREIYDMDDIPLQPALVAAHFIMYHLTDDERISDRQHIVGQQRTAGRRTSWIITD